MKKKVAIFTGNRAEYGLQLPILDAVANHPDLEYRLIVSGAHLDDNFGNTLDMIRSDGYTVHATPEIHLERDDLYSTARAIGSGIIAMSDVLEEMKPDILVVYADRFEGFAAVIAASQMNIPVAHVEGGDLTEGGALDDSVRHAMTKLSHLHFTTNEQAEARVLKMGEEEWRVFNVGLPSIDMIVRGRYATPEKISLKFGLDLSQPVILFTQHSVTTEFDRAVEQVESSLKALKKLAGKGCQVIITYPNNDAGGVKIIQRLQAMMAGGDAANIQLHRTLGTFYYHGILALAGDAMHRVVCAGNSSSGIKETPVFRCPAINIGPRQKGRLRAMNVIDVGYDARQIYEKIQFALYDADFREQCRKVTNPYGDGHAGEKIAEVLAGVEYSDRLLQKRMTI
jgi:UDP-N-acetylglucosamine 2-epimerase (non-hydrolysing)/GDP/UDP-N,N'-diacetylbacillosamine 2-epimerase (hydrolysing)